MANKLLQTGGPLSQASIPVTQSNMNWTPSRWWGRNQRVSMGSTSTAAGAASAAGNAARSAGAGSHRIKGSIPGGRSSCI